MQLMQPILQLEMLTGNLGAASSAAIDIAEQIPEQMQPLLRPAVMPLPGLAQQVIASSNCQHESVTPLPMINCNMDALLPWPDSSLTQSLLRLVQNSHPWRE